MRKLCSDRWTQANSYTSIAKQKRHSASSLTIFIPALLCIPYQSFLFSEVCLFPATLSQIMGDDKGFYYSQHGSQHKFHVYIFSLWPQVPGEWWIAIPSQTLYIQWRNENLGNPNLKQWLLENLYNFCTEGDITFIFPGQQTNLSSAPDWTTLATVQLFTI